jgi:hypothetical protein
MKHSLEEANMENSEGETDFRTLYFRAVLQWADANLRGESRDPLLPPFAMYPDRRWREVSQRLAVIESRLGDLQSKPSQSPFRCLLASCDDGGDGLARLLVGAAGGAATREEGIKEIRDFTRDAEKLVVVDPYAYGGEAAFAAGYVDELCRAARVDGKTLRHLHIVYNSAYGNTQAVKNELSARAAGAKVKLTDCDTAKVHDRIWLADGSRGLVVGTSFGGLGKRAAFLLELPKVDLGYIVEFLQANQLLVGQVRRPKEPGKGRKRSSKR